MDLSELENVLLQPDFDVEKHAASLVQQGVDITRYVNNLSDAERSLDEKLEDHVSLHHNDLLCQATSVERLDTHLSSVSGREKEHSIYSIYKFIYLRTVCPRIFYDNFFSGQAENLLTLVDRLTSRVNDDAMKGRVG